MSVQLTIPYETLIELVDQLPDSERQGLLDYLLMQANHRELTPQEKIALFEAMIIDLGAVSPSYSDRRENWYQDDGR